jgi:hypothetical protein
VGGDSTKLHSVCWGVNYGLQEFADSQLGLALALSFSGKDANQAAANGLASPSEAIPAVLASVLEGNPYNLAAAHSLAASAGTLKDPAQLIDLWNGYHRAVEAGKTRTGCPQSGGVSGEVWRGIRSAVERLPVPEDGERAAKVYGALAREGCSPALMVRYQLRLEGVDATLASTAEKLRSHVASNRNPGSCGVMSSHISAAAALFQDADKKKAWSAEQMKMLAGKEMYLYVNGRTVQVQTDACTTTLCGLAGVPLDKKRCTESLMDQMTAMLKAHLAGKRDTPGCQKMAQKLTVATQAARACKINLAPWADAWFRMMSGKQRYAPHAWCAKDASAVVIEKLKAEGVRPQ